MQILFDPFLDLLIIPHHYEASGNRPTADLNAFAQELARLAPDTTLRVNGFSSLPT